MVDAADVRVAVIGLGFGAVHARVLAEMEGVDLVAVCDQDARRLAAVARGRAVATYTDYRQLLSEHALEAVIVAVPTRLHDAVARAAIEAGVGALLVEKPLTPSLAEGRLLAEAADRAGVSLMAGHIERFNPAIVELRRRLQGGQAGRVFQLSARRLGPFAARTRDVSVIHDLAFHDIDVMRHLIAADVERVFAETRTGVRTGFDDSVAGLIRFEGDGPIGVLDVNWLTPKKVRDLRVLGAEGTFIADYADILAPTLEFHEADSGEHAGITTSTFATLVNVRGRETAADVRIAIEPREPLERELSAFIAAVRLGATMPVAAADALAALAIADALAESGRTGVPVRPEAI